MWDDTLGLAKRVIKAERYSLDVLARQLGLRCGPRHHALADAEITAQLLERIIRELKLTCLKREALVRQYAHIFKPLSLKLEQWRSDCDRLQVSDLLEKIIKESGLGQYTIRVSPSGCVI